jgi:hypothetical protein
MIVGYQYIFKHILVGLPAHTKSSFIDQPPMCPGVNAIQTSQLKNQQKKKGGDGYEISNKLNKLGCNLKPIPRIAFCNQKGQVENKIEILFSKFVGLTRMIFIDFCTRRPWLGLKIIRKLRLGLSGE